MPWERQNGRTDPRRVPGEIPGGKEKAPNTRGTPGENYPGDTGEKTGRSLPGQQQNKGPNAGKTREQRGGSRGPGTPGFSGARKTRGGGKPQPAGWENPGNMGRPKGARGRGETPLFGEKCGKKGRGGGEIQPAGGKNKGEHLGGP